ncbi:MAG: HD domain-containing protein [Candidatus Omnitrophica bacterium]|jgi:putative nucleotidyltransferase with HDIG domain|nr:HD domain-containing protein [Candidatus Omnitrophota bacterium]MDD4012625.1 HD domain-containing protein [Candidatus Omnitrophota bacterium]
MERKATAGKRNKNSKKLSGLFFDKLIQYALEPVMVTDSKGELVYANKEFVSFYALSPDEAHGKKWDDIMIPRENRDDAGNVFKCVKNRRSLCFFDTPAPGWNRTCKHISWVAIPFKKESTPFYLFVGGEKPLNSKPLMEVRDAVGDAEANTHRDLVDMLVEASWNSEPETAKHSARVMELSVALARKIGMSKKRVERLKIASLLHDLGKLGVDEKILFKKGRLDKTEFEEIRKHPEWGAEAAGHLYFLRDIIPIMADHHENYDGSGYPRGKKGSRIPLEARVLSVADIYEALTADRPYRKGFSSEEAIKIMEDEKGRKLDPKITEVFFKMIKKKNGKWGWKKI